MRGESVSFGPTPPPSGDAPGGIGALDAIRIATLNAAVFLGKDDELGSIEAGKIADLVLLHADPLQNISHTEDIALVIKGGIVVDRSTLDLPINR